MKSLIYEIWFTVSIINLLLLVFYFASLFSHPWVIVVVALNLAEQLWRVIMELNRRRKLRAAQAKPNFAKENKLKKVLSAFSAPRL